MKSFHVMVLAFISLFISNFANADNGASGKIDGQAISCWMNIASNIDPDSECVKESVTNAVGNPVVNALQFLCKRIDDPSLQVRTLITRGTSHGFYVEISRLVTGTDSQPATSIDNLASLDGLRYEFEGPKVSQSGRLHSILFCSQQ